MRNIRKRVQRLEAIIRAQPPCVAFSQKDFERAALRKLSAADRALLQAKRSDSENTKEYEDLLTRWEAALAAASREAGVIYFTPEDLGWL